MSFGSMHLGHFHLTNLLVDCLKKSATPQSRVINVCSEAHRGVSLDWHDLHWEKHEYNPFLAYRRAKLATALFTLELSNKLKSNKKYTH